MRGWEEKDISSNPTQASVYVFVYIRFGFVQRARQRPGDELGVAECHQCAPGNKWCKKLQSKPLTAFPSHCNATQPAQYLLRHLQSNLGWQAQMAPLIQVNYLWTFQSKQTCRSPEGWALIAEKRGGERGHANARVHACKLWQCECRPCLCQNMTVRTTFFFFLCEKVWPALLREKKKKIRASSIHCWQTLNSTKDKDGNFKGLVVAYS